MHNTELLSRINQNRILSDDVMEEVQSAYNGIPEPRLSMSLIVRRNLDAQKHLSVLMAVCEQNQRAAGSVIKREDL